MKWKIELKKHAITKKAKSKEWLGQQQSSSSGPGCKTGFGSAPWNLLLLLSFREKELGVTQAAEPSKHEQYKRMLLPHEEGSFWSIKVLAASLSPGWAVIGPESG